MSAPDCPSSRPDERTPLVQPESEGQTQSGAALATLRLLGASSAGLVADGYDLCVINLVMALLATLYPESMGPLGQGLAVSMTMLGVIIGMMYFGTVADMVGRKKASLCTASFTVLGAVLSSCVTDAPGYGGMAVQLAVCRFILGLGIGGEYPLSAAIGTEVSFNKGGNLICSRKQLLIANMAMFNFGTILQAVLVIVLVDTALPLEYVWRLALLGGVVPSVTAIIFRITMEEPVSPELADSNSGRREASSFAGNFSEIFAEKKHVLFGACLSWMLFNAVNYSLMSFSHVLCEDIFEVDRKNDSLHKIIHLDAMYALTLAFCGMCAQLALVCIGELSNRSLQFFSFAGASFLIALSAVLLPRDLMALEVAIQLVLVCCMSMLGVATYLVPTENFPASVRATCVGIAAASGKFGALIGTSLFPVAVASFGLQAVLLGGAFIMLSGCVVTSLFTPEGTSTSEKGRASSSKVA
ncbi:unnamed protein product [Polarella glacialis]|uniref:Major facilitator superfamily (MFS) profile domain-containing protein n=1 Tax=Polarella glacialis TaxID=89957 RepID=A0A813FLP3_POLGL|nr:unnamed protein product [Polarella glacialis]